MSSNPEKIFLITGCAGFIGFFLSSRLLTEGFSVIGLDNMNDYYDVSLKQARLTKLKNFEKFQCVFASLEDTETINKLFTEHKIAVVINLAAQAGVRYSLENPRAYTSSNIVGFLNILEACRHYPVEHLIYASSSSVYGGNTQMPFSTKDNVDHPISLYAATKKGNELMAYTYSHLYGIKTTGLRFFTVYGPWGRPDMALFKFTKAILHGHPIDVYNFGKMKRDFTYIDDIVEGMFRLIEKQGPNGTTPYKIYNIGNNKPINILDFINVLEEKLGRKAKKIFLPMQPGDVPETYADITDLTEATGFTPTTSIEEGISRFVQWYVDYYQVDL